MNTALSFFLLAIVLLAPFGLVAALTARSHSHGYLNQFRFATPTVSRLLEDRDSDSRRIDHDLDAIRTRFEQHPAWPGSGGQDGR